MKILMIAPQPFLEPRGTPISVYQRLQGLSRLGHEVDLLAYHLGENVEFPGVTIHRTPRLPFIKELKVGPSLPKIPLDVLLFFKTIWMLLRKRYDVIHAHEEAAIFSTQLARLFRTQHLYDMHSSLPRQLVNFNFGNRKFFLRLFERFERWTIHGSQALITIGPDLQELVEQIRPGAPQVMIENLPMRTKRSANEPSLETLKENMGLAGKKLIVYTGTFERYQGVHLLIESLAMILPKHPEVVLLLAGGKPIQIAQMKELAESLQVQDAVRFLGTVPVDTANTYLDMGDILVSPRVEGTSVPLKIYTYLLCGKPIVATNLLAHTLVLDDETAMLVDPTKEAFAAAFLALLDDPALGARLGQQAFNLAKEKYSPANYMSKLEEIYKTFQPNALPPGGQALYLKELKED